MRFTPLNNTKMNNSVRAEATKETERGQEEYGVESHLPKPEPEFITPALKRTQGEILFCNKNLLIY